MPELQIDVAVANRFISSLSKSLQALCHGCMDFDNGIEIVGYININIDSGSKVDYVLNEKVLKSTTNSMTFVSNSFLARKEQQKQTRDGVCSPIPQTQVTPSYNARMRGAHFGSPYQRSALPFSPHSQVLRGSQKRTRTDDLRFPSKKYHHNPSTESPYSGQAVQHSHLMPASATSSYIDSNLKQAPSDSDAVNDNTLQLQMRIKEEALEADSQKDLDTDDQKLDSSHDEISKFKVKSDPDEAMSNHEQTALTDSTIDNEDKDLKRHFLDPSSEDNQQLAEESSGSLQSDNHHPTFDLRSESAKNIEQNLTDEVKIPSTSAHDLGNNDTGMTTENEPESDTQVEYDQAAEDGSYSQSAYEDTGEGSSEAGQFEVIEIDDEDEDVQAMFGDQHSAHSPFLQPLGTPRPNQHHRALHNTSYSSPEAGHPREKQEQSYSVYDPSCNVYRCPACGKEYKTATGARLHYKIKHCGAFDHYCQACGKGFQQKSHLKAHMSLHMQIKDFECSICGSQYAHKTSLTAHQKLAHGI